MRRRRCLAALGLSIVAGSALAAGLQLQPVALALAPGESSATVWLDNRGTTPLRVQARVFAWRQSDGDDELQPTREVALSPATMLIPPGARQRLRVVVLEPPAGSAAESQTESPTERSYRLIIDELDPQQALAARFSLPLFVNANAHADAGELLRLGLTALDPASTRLRIDNPGRHHAKLVDLAYRRPDGSLQMLAPSLAGYVLAGRYKHWTLDEPMAHFEPGSFELMVNGKTLRLRPQQHDP